MFYWKQVDITGAIENWRPLHIIFNSSLMDKTAAFSQMIFSDIFIFVNEKFCILI